MGMQLVGSVASAYGAMSNAAATASADNYSSQVASRNAVAVQQQADQTAELLRRQSQQKIGTMVASYGASGVTLEGSPADSLANSASNAALDAETAQYRAGLKIAGYNAEAALDTAAAGNATTAGYFSASSVLLNGASSALTTYGDSLKTKK